MTISDLGFEVLTFAQLGRRYGTSTNQAWTWYQRRDVNGFPEPIIWKQWGPNQRVPLFDPEETDAWHETYTPTKIRNGNNSVAPVGSSREMPVTLPDGSVVSRDPLWLPIGQIATATGASITTATNWVSRSSYNEFPEPVGTTLTVAGTEKRLYDLPMVMHWRSTYRPKSGPRSADKHA